MNQTAINIIKHTVQSNTSSKVYNVLQEGDHFICDCKGYEIKRDCKHIQEVKNKILFLKEKEALRADIQDRIKMFMAQYQMTPQIKINNKGDVTVKFIF